MLDRKSAEPARRSGRKGPAAKVRKVHLARSTVTFCGYDRAGRDTAAVDRVTCLRCLDIAIHAYNIEEARARRRFVDGSSGALRLFE